MAYKKVRAYRVGDVEVEFWQAFREIGKIVYREGKSELEFPAEWLGWTTRKPDWLGVSLPHTLLEEGRIGPRIESVAAQIHLALTLMKIPNVVTVQSQSVDASAEDREKILNEFIEWMRHRGWHVNVKRLGALERKLQIKRRGFSFFRRRLTAGGIVAQGKRVARAFEALVTSSRKEVTLYIGERARHGTVVVSVEW